jgi:hypothetical protein
MHELMHVSIHEASGKAEEEIMLFFLRLVFGN